MSDGREKQSPPEGGGLPAGGASAHEGASSEGAASPKVRGSSPRSFYPLALAVAAGATVLSVLILAMLAVTYVQMQRAYPVDSRELAEMKAALRAPGADAALADQYRRRDLELRRHYFARRATAERHAWELLIVVVVGLAAGKIAIDLRKHLPRPDGEAPAAGAAERSAWRWAVALVGVFLAGGAIGLALSFESVIPPPTATDASRLANPQTTTPANGGQAEKPPTAEEIARNWPRFRGPGGRGLAAFTNYPATWDGAGGKNILWKTEVPLPGENSPVVWGDRVFVTGANKKTREVFCFGLADGKLKWRTAVVAPDTPAEPPEIMDDTGYAAPTAATDGRVVCAIFANGDLAGLDMDGKVLWVRNLGTPHNTYGHAASLLISGDRLIVQFDQQHDDDGQPRSELIAFEAMTGIPAWVQSRPVGDSWTSPIVIPSAKGEQIVTAAEPWVISYDVKTGNELWKAELLSPDAAPSPTFADGLVYVTNAMAVVAAIKPDGEGNVTESHVVWKADEGLPDMVSPLTDGKRLWLIDASGTLTCYDAKAGRKLYEHDMQDSFTASPVLIGGKVHATSVKGRTFVFAADADEYKQAAVNALDETVHATPAYVDGRIVFRGGTSLYCVGKKE